MFGAELLFVLLSPWARAEYRHRVVLLEPPAAESSVEVRARLRGELSAAGFDVITLPVTEISDPKLLSETAARDLQPSAVLFIVEPVGPSDQIRQASIWLSDRLLRRTFVLTYSVDPADPGRDSARVAVQVAEILKADLAELSVTREEKAKREPEPKPERPPPPLERPEPLLSQRLGDGFRIEGGVALLQGFDGFGSALTPLVRVGASLPSFWFRRAPLALDLVLTGAAFGSAARAEHEGSSATMRQSLATFGVTARIAPTSPVQPMLSVSSGAYRMAWAGSAEPPLTAHQGRTWSGVSGAGAGVWLQPTGGFALTLQGEVLSAWARTVVRFEGESGASAGSPMVLGSATLVGVF